MSLQLGDALQQAAYHELLGRSDAQQAAGLGKQVDQIFFLADELRVVLKQNHPLALNADDEGTLNPSAAFFLVGSQNNSFVPALPTSHQLQQNSFC